jgi:hypothetical protein
MDRVLIGTDARWFLEDVELLSGEGVGQPILIGMDLAPGPELVAVRLTSCPREVVVPPDAKRTHPTTARELRRAERRRRR